MMDDKCSVYWIHESTDTNVYTQGYVGITKDPQRRLKEHTKKNRTDPTNRIFEILFTGSRDECKQLEEDLRPTSNIGLNVAPGGFEPPNVTGIKRSAETKAKMSANNVGMKGKKHSEESRKKMSIGHKGQLAWNKGKKMPATMICDHKGSKNPMFGRKHSDETKRKISERMQKAKKLNDFVSNNTVS